MGVWEVFFFSRAAGQSTSLSPKLRSPILLGNAIGGIPDPEPIIPDSGVWWWAEARRRWQPRQGTQRPVELTEVKLHAQTERARRERERGGDPGRTEELVAVVRTNPYRGVFSPFIPRPRVPDHTGPPGPSVRPPSAAIILAVSDDANLYPSHSTPRPCERSVGLSHVCDKVADYIPTFLAGRGVAAIEQQKRGREWRK